MLKWWIPEEEVSPCIFNGTEKKWHKKGKFGVMPCSVSNIRMWLPEIGRVHCSRNVMWLSLSASPLDYSKHCTLICSEFSAPLLANAPQRLIIIASTAYGQAVINQIWMGTFVADKKKSDLQFSLRCCQKYVSVCQSSGQSISHLCC